MDGGVILRISEEGKGAQAVKLRSFCHQKSPRKEETHRHIHPTLEAFYFEKGRGVVEVGKSVLLVKAHDLYFVIILQPTIDTLV